jgi:hypothetical protein
MGDDLHTRTGESLDPVEMVRVIVADDDRAHRLRGFPGDHLG